VLVLNEEKKKSTGMQGMSTVPVRRRRIWSKEKKRRHNFPQELRTAWVRSYSKQGKKKSKGRDYASGGLLILKRHLGR